MTFLLDESNQLERLFKLNKNQDKSQKRKLSQLNLTHTPYHKYFKSMSIKIMQEKQSKLYFRPQCIKHTDWNQNETLSQNETQGGRKRNLILQKDVICHLYLISYIQVNLPQQKQMNIETQQQVQTTDQI